MTFAVVLFRSMDVTLDVSLSPDQSAALAAEADTRQSTIAALLHERLSDVLAADVRTYRASRGEPASEDARVDELRSELDKARQTVTAFDSIIEGLRGEIADKDRQISDSQAQIEKVSARLTEKDAQILDALAQRDSVMTQLSQMKQDQPPAPPDPVDPAPPAQADTADAQQSDR